MWRVLIVVAMVFVMGMTNAVAAHSDPAPTPIECPQSHAHVWDEAQCEAITPGQPLGGGGGGHCGVVCGIRHIIGGLL